MRKSQGAGRRYLALLKKGGQVRGSQRAGRGYLSLLKEKGGGYLFLLKGNDGWLWELQGERRRGLVARIFQYRKKKVGGSPPTPRYPRDHGYLS